LICNDLARMVVSIRDSQKSMDFGSHQEMPKPYMARSVRTKQDSRD